MARKREITSDVFGSHAFYQYTPEELLQWFRLLVKRAKRRRCDEKREEDVTEARKYYWQLTNRLKTMLTDLENPKSTGEHPSVHTPERARSEESE